MHQSSFDHVQSFCKKHLSQLEHSSLKIFDIGSQDVNGSYREIFSKPNWAYVGVDMAEGKNVDLVLKNPYHWREIKSGSADVVVSGQAFEHIDFFWHSALEMSRILKPNGLCCLLVPSSGPEHKYPIDCWRFYPDGLRAIARYAGLEVISAYTDWDGSGGEGAQMWRDSVLIARKPNTVSYKTRFRQLIYQWALTHFTE